MKHTEQLTKYVGNFIDELVKGEMTDVVISPGSRSTPLAMMFAEHSRIQHWVHMDERSAGFFALGLAKSQQKPVALVCTSGTAAANYYPAVVEAYYSRVPLLVLTADRPHELRDVGAPQAIDQMDMFRNYVKWFQEMALPEDSSTMLQYVRSVAARAYHTAKEGNAGPVHLNFPFREPLLPDFSLDNVWGEEGYTSHHSLSSGKRTLDKWQLQQLKEQLSHYKKGLIVCGPQMNHRLIEPIVQLARHMQLPILADPLSQLRSGLHDKDLIIESYDAILKNEAIRVKWKPDFIIRFGAMPVSKPFTLMLKSNPNITQFIVEDVEGYREPNRNQAQFIYADGSELCNQLVEHAHTWNFDKKWLSMWQRANEITKACLIEDQHAKPLMEGHVITNLMENAPEESAVFIGNSMPVRDLDTFFMTTPKQIEVYANRGANGIDGLISTALGVAASGKQVTLILGDLSFYHDLNGLLMAKQYQMDIRIIVINNEGGGIFSFLPQANHPNHFEVLFGTPLHLDFEKVVHMYGGNFTSVDNWNDFSEVVDTSFRQHALNVIEVNTDRQTNVNWHRDKWYTIEQALNDLLETYQ
ncbi:2-succinyl-5-enolpyruvyl-6-hydroxy-3-cyclohexene-1-carboxylic-acid synthase [Pontibacillus litoralis]|uniref:2-succinyl-5-enolpyruvyl-6-hydroxy-3-cyclohexene-1-carboxylate synthase n=1 Tax=Pontibacillus litoralis JSM 072002 TaxID=1385512 RepID=A0A0A5HSX5_9BACI|nr:2-succinyl-5-enolpyruvyl-6-hydroxy-3-cyclohexene-1-carboxylic-acid synthase [Pontibacillus litoralis]KGX86747.1 2-succinyl-5-enolpyruvyl-6-hydroxy-3-cyclohexene-1-carboxylate synthase [Pontibacillus litoralis JSM 072002]